MSITDLKTIANQCFADVGTGIQHSNVYGQVPGVKTGLNLGITNDPDPSGP